MQLRHHAPGLHGSSVRDGRVVRNTATTGVVRLTGLTFRAFRCGMPECEPFHTSRLNFRLSSRVFTTSEMSFS